MRAFCLLSLLATGPSWAAPAAGAFRVPDTAIFSSPHAAQAMQPPEGARVGPRARPPSPPTAEGPPDVVVYGYLAYWAGSVETVPYASLTHLAIFNVDLLSDGRVAFTDRWTGVAPRAVELAAPYGVRVHLTLTCFDDAVMESVLPSSTRRATLVDQLGDLVEAAGAHGVSVDCEGMPSALRDDFVVFVRALRDRVPEVSVALPAVDWTDAYDYDALADIADQLFIMGYGYHWSGGDPGPNAPLVGGAGWATWSLAWSVEDYRDNGVPDSKIVLGLPLYGQRWPTSSTAVPGTSTGTASSVVMENAVVEAAATGRLWEAHTSTPYAFPSSTRQLWYDDTESIAIKAGWAVEQGLGGFGFWALDYEGGDPAFWAAIDAISHVDSPAPDTGGATDGGAVDGGAADGGAVDGGAAEGGGVDGATADAGADGGSATDAADTGGSEGALGARFGKAVGCATAGPAALLLLGLGALSRRRRGGPTHRPR